ncbi:family 43 glycosylhydrolase [uncultured Sphaerochaeta sp.]|uniref:family 43 glycosylhydrolase n=1 Tax=uncultured Sphaerochaeta sp. TaxID=886478 RepID=UPI002A0A6799|nr:family 43 glycosylhydrolase [uncultured Sphaerochaeta sp.]
MLKNPILHGFKPDPSILRVDDVYYIATSTFEWFPGIKLFMSSDLANWKQLPSPLQDQLGSELRGVDSSCGLWAPHLSYDQGIFYLLYTIVYTDRSRFKDTWNYLVTAEDIQGPWSSPIFLNRSGWDPSFFRNGDGSLWLCNVCLDYRPDRNRFGGVRLQQLNKADYKLFGPIHTLFKGSAAGKTEGPNLFFRDGFYYLVTAEGGTEFGHQVTVARSSSLLGPYTVSPYNPLLTNKSGKCIQRAGHGTLFQTSGGGWYIVYLCSVPLAEKYSVLGRETAIQSIIWTSDGWPVLSDYPNRFPHRMVKELPSAVEQPQEEAILFKAGKALDVRCMSLREPALACGISIGKQDDKLFIQGGNSLSSKFHQGLLAISLTNLACEYCTLMDFSPRHSLHGAGLVIYYNNDNYQYLCKTLDDDLVPIVCIVSVIGRQVSLLGTISVESARPLYLRARIKGNDLDFYYGYTEEEAILVNPAPLEMYHLSDEEIEGNGFTGTSVGLCCQDLNGDGVTAKFSFLKWKNL